MNKPIVIKGALSKDICKVIEVYCLIREKRSEIYNGDDAATRERDVVGAYSVYVDPITESLMLFLMKKIEDGVNLRLIPTYSFFRTYRNGQELIKHVDREACEVTASLFLGKGYRGKDWPLFIDGEEISLEVGDMVVYRGSELEHWRETFKFDGYHTQAFLHFVDANGVNADQKFDKRKSIYHKDRKTQ